MPPRPPHDPKSLGKNPVVRARQVVADARQAIVRTNEAITRLRTGPDQSSVAVPKRPGAWRDGDSTDKAPARPSRRPG